MHEYHHNLNHLVLLSRRLRPSPQSIDSLSILFAMHLFSLHFLEWWYLSLFLWHKDFCFCRVYLYHPWQTKNIISALEIKLFLPIPLEVDLDCASSFAFLGVTRLLFLLLRQVHNIYLQSYAVFCIEHHVMTVAFQLFFQGILYRQSTAFGTNKPQVLSIHIPLNYTIYRVYNDISHQVLVTVSWYWWQIDDHDVI